VTQGDRERWNAKWRERAGELEAPAAFLVEHTHLLPPRGRALDLAGGAGRHTSWLARAGLTVTLIDVADVALDQAARRLDAAGLAAQVRLIRADLTDLDALRLAPFDVIVVYDYLDRDRRDAVAALLAGGGLLCAAQPTTRNLERHASPGARFLLDEGELERWARDLGLEPVVSREGWTADGRHEAALIARRQAPRTPTM
jgi:tRNA A58 N-methylase Trm61